MKLLLLVCVTLAGALGYKIRASSDKAGVCPEPSGMAGICVFDPDVNCLSDSECSGALKCCSEGCGKVCKAPLSSTRVHAGTCPEPSGNAGICMLLPNNCSGDASCAADQKCCPEGCNLVCKKAIQTVG